MNKKVDHSEWTEKTTHCNSRTFFFKGKGADKKHSKNFKQSQKNTNGTVHVKNISKQDLLVSLTFASMNKIRVRTHVPLLSRPSQARLPRLSLFHVLSNYGQYFQAKIIGKRTAPKLRFLIFLILLC